MKKLFVMILLVGVFVGRGYVFGEDNNSDITEKEHNKWINEYKRWQQITEEWSGSEYDTEDYDDIKKCKGDKCWEIDPINVKYCIGQKCWKSGLLNFTIIDFDGNEVEARKDGVGFHFDIFSYNGNKWEDGEYNGKDGEKWRDGNLGQVLYYRDKNGNEWKSINFGQEIIYKGANDEEWSSIGFGKSGEDFRTNIDGQEWEGSFDDTKNSF